MHRSALAALLWLACPQRAAANDAATLALSAPSADELSVEVTVGAAGSLACGAVSRAVPAAACS